MIGRFVITRFSEGRDKRTLQKRYENLSFILGTLFCMSIWSPVELFSEILHKMVWVSIVIAMETRLPRKASNE